MVAGSKHNNWVSVAPGDELRGDAAASYLRMIADGMPGGGTQVFRRMWGKQAELRRMFERGLGPIAARPSWRAPHIQGVAIDNQTTVGNKYKPSGTHRWMTKGGSGASKPRPGEKLRAHNYGWRRTVPTERWHFEYDPKLDKHAASDLRTRLTMLGYTGPDAVKDFQRNNKLAVDGAAGPATWTKLLKSPKPKKVPVPVKPIPSPTPPVLTSVAEGAEVGSIYAVQQPDQY